MECYTSLNGGTTTDLSPLQICKCKISRFKIIITYNSTTKRSKVIEKKMKKDKDLFELSVNVEGSDLSTEFIWKLYKTPNQIKKLFVKVRNSHDYHRY